MKPSIIVLISGNGSNLQAIIDNCKNVKIECVISDKGDARGLHRAAEAGIDNVWFGERPNQSREDYCDELSLFISKLKPDLIVLAGFMKILFPGFFDRFHEKQITNIHPSLLPRYTGLHTHQRVLNNEDKEHGMTIHYVTEELDAGPIICQKSFPVTRYDNIKTLEEKVHKLEHIWYPKTIDRLMK